VGHYDVDLRADKLRGQRWQAVKLPLRPAIFDDEISTFLVSALSKTLSQRGGLAGEVWGRSLAEKTEPVDSVRGLRLGGERRGKQRGSTSNERAPLHHSIT
jgi:hypothetical protein